MNTNSHLHSLMRQWAAPLEKHGICLQVEWKTDAECAGLTSTDWDRIVGNLFQNALRAMPNGGSLTVSRHSVMLAAGTGVAGDMRASKKRLVQFRVADTGEGIDPVSFSRLFEPYFTTRPLSGGNGLGLSSIHRLVCARGGFVVVESAPSEGTSFTLYLPEREFETGQ